MEKETAEKLAEYLEATKSAEGMAAYFERLKVKLNEEVQALQPMSREQLIQYAAETRIFMCELQN